MVAANNLYHSAETTEQLAALVVDCARRQGKRVAVVGVGGLSGGLFTAGIDPASDRISSPADDSWNLQILELISQGQVSALRQAIPSFAKETRADMGLKHLHWILGALDGRFDGARVHHYGALYGTGAAVVEFSL
ncbi:2-aminophenol 1,6-dioxygenase subunit alpha [compost metagenome]